MTHLFTAKFKVCQLLQFAALILVGSVVNLAKAGPAVQSLGASAEPSSASISILLDNYDIWANEVIKESSLVLVSESSSMSDQIVALKEFGEQADRQSRESLQSLAFHAGDTSVAFEAAILLSKRTTGQNRALALSRAYRLAQVIRPQSADALRVLIMLSLHHLLSLETQAAARLRPDLERLVSKPSLASDSIRCMGRLLIGDISFSMGEFERSASEYERVAQCRTSHSLSGVRESSRLVLRRAWAAFRLSRYDDALSFLAVATPLIASESRPLQEALTEDLAHVFGVSLSEMAPSVPSALWTKSAAAHDWVARGLVQALLYLSRSDRSDLALQWSEYLEPSIRALKVAPEFYAAALTGAQQSGRVDRANELKIRAVIALRIGGAFGRSVGSLSDVNRRRADMVIRLSREVADTFSALIPSTVGKKLPLHFAQVVDAFLGEKIDVCGESKTLIQSHRFLAAARQPLLAERIRGLLDGCSLSLAERGEVVSAHVEMLRDRWKRSSRSPSDWLRYHEAMLDLLRDSSGVKTVRQIGLEAATDALTLGRYQDSQSLVDVVFSTLSALGSDEDRQFETEAIVSVMAALLARQVTRESTELLAWDMKAQFLPILGRLNKSYRELEWSLAAAIQARSNALRSQGDILGAFDLLHSAAIRLGQESVVGRDLMFMAIRLSCTTALDDQCLSVAANISTAPPYAAEERYLAARWRAAVMRSRGRFLSAANVIVDSIDDALLSERVDMISLAHSDLLEAGRVYSDLFLWSKTVDIRSLLAKIAPRLNRSRKTISSIIDWSLKAIDSGAYVVAAELSSGLSALASRDGASLRTNADLIEPLFVDLVGSYARYRSRVGTADELDQVLIRLSGLYRQQLGKQVASVVSSSGRDQFIDDVISFRLREILKSYKVYSIGRQENVSRLASIRSDRQKVKVYCEMERSRAIRVLPSNRACLSEFSSLALNIVEGMKRTSRLSLSAEPSGGQVESLQEIDALARSLKSALVGSDQGHINEAASSFVVFDRDAVSRFADLGQEKGK